MTSTKQLREGGAALDSRQFHCRKNFRGKSKKVTEVGIDDEI